LARPALLHVTNGESAAATLRRTALGGAVLSWQDALHEGPVPKVARPELLRARADFLAGCGWGSRRTLLSSLVRRDRTLTDALRDGLHVVLWFEHDLYDQLQLVDVLALAHVLGRSPELVVVGSFPGKPGFAGLGELTGEELESLWPERRPAPGDVLDEAATVWDALRQAEPTALAEAAARRPPGLPFLARAHERLLEELPSSANGLSGTEHRALTAVASGARGPAEAFLAAQRLEEAPFLGDTWFYRTLAALGAGAVRLVEAEDGMPLPPPPPLGDARLFLATPLRLTPEGERVLRGESDRVELLGVDRWIGGTHVIGRDPWRWDEVGKTVVSS
jgi:hypothetical protein